MVIKGCISLVLIMLFMTFSSCFTPDENVEDKYDEYMSMEPETVIDVENELNLDLKDAEIEFNHNEHGFFGDGEQIVVLYFYETIENQLKNNENWNELPLTENPNTALYGNEYTSPDFTRGETDKPVLPEIENGYWCFYDRHSESSDPKDDSELDKRSSVNYTVAVYDSDENTLYYLKTDS